MDILPLLSCPSCRGDLKETGKQVVCTACSATYPTVDGVPWLFHPAGETLAAWRVRFNALLASIATEEETLKAAQKDRKLSELTSKRLKRNLQARVEQRKLLTNLMAPLLKEPSSNPDLYQGMQLHDTAGQSITGYYANIHRDWAWETNENAECARVVSALLDRCANSKRVLILGAGAGRLAWDLHHQRKHELTVALDINPLMILAARKVTKGRNLKLYEFPIAPRNLESQAVLQTCSSPRDTDKNLHFLLADGLNPPVKPEAFDVILTPWFIDIIPSTLLETAGTINNLLAPGCQWVNFGSLVFAHKDPAMNFSQEEAATVVGDCGFVLTHTERVKIPYMQSPHSAHGRIEETFCFVATKEHAFSNARNASEPKWLRDFSIQIPQERVFASTGLVYSIYLDVLAQINGTTSINDIAKNFAQKHGLSLEDAAASVRNFLTRLI